MPAQPTTKGLLLTQDAMRMITAKLGVTIMTIFGRPSYTDFRTTRTSTAGFAYRDSDINLIPATATVLVQPAVCVGGTVQDVVAMEDDAKIRLCGIFAKSGTETLDFQPHFLHGLMYS